MSDRRRVDSDVSASTAMDVTAFAPYVEATAMGLGVGLEREWSHRGGEQQSAGSRTFAVLGLAGAVAAELGNAVIGAGAIAVAALLVAGYLRTARIDRGTTTEVAAFATYLLGALLLRDAELAIGLAVVMATLLAAKGPIHRFARQVVSDTEVEDALRFFVIAFVVLPLLPDRKVGPYGVLNPFKIWVLVVALTGIGWAGYIAVRALGARRGLLITGFAGGFISATATTASLARLAARVPTARPAALAGALLASTATLVQLATVVSVANPDLLRRLAPALGAGLAVICAEVLVLLRRLSTRQAPAEPHDDAGIGKTRPFSLWPALVLASVLTAVLLAARWLSDVLGSGGAVLAAGVAGTADAHAPVLAVATLANNGALSLHTALLAAALALGVNTAAKCVLAFATGGASFGRRFSALLLAPVATVAGGVILQL